MVSRALYMHSQLGQLRMLLFQIWEGVVMVIYLKNSDGIIFGSFRRPLKQSILNGLGQLRMHVYSRR